MILLNSLTPVFFIGFTKLLIGNLIIGLIEAKIIKIVFKHNVRTYLIIVGNYFSAIIGWVIAFNLLDNTELNIVRGYKEGTFGSSLFAYTGIAYLITLVSEYYFFKKAIQKQINKQRLIKILITTHIISYVLCIVTWYSTLLFQVR